MRRVVPIGARDDRCDDLPVVGPSQRRCLEEAIDEANLILPIVDPGRPDLDPRDRLPWRDASGRPVNSEYFLTALVNYMGARDTGVSPGWLRELRVAAAGCGFTPLSLDSIGRSTSGGPITYRWNGRDSLPMFPLGLRPIPECTVLRSPSAERWLREGATTGAARDEVWRARARLPPCAPFARVELVLTTAMLSCLEMARSRAQVEAERRYPVGGLALDPAGEQYNEYFMLFFLRLARDCPALYTFSEADLRELAMRTMAYGEYGGPRQLGMVAFLGPRGERILQTEMPLVRCQRD